MTLEYETDYGASHYGGPLDPTVSTRQTATTTKARVATGASLFLDVATNPCAAIICPPGEYCSKGECRPMTAPAPTPAATPVKTELTPEQQAAQAMKAKEEAAAQADAELRQKQQEAYAAELALANKAAEEQAMKLARELEMKAQVEAEEQNMKLARELAMKAQAEGEVKVGRPKATESHSQADPAGVTCPEGFEMNPYYSPAVTNSDGTLSSSSDTRPCIPATKKGGLGAGGLAIAYFIGKALFF